MLIQLLRGLTWVEEGKQATRFIVWCSFCGHLAANTAPEQKRHPISFVLEQSPRGTHEAMQSGRGDPCGRPWR